MKIFFINCYRIVYLDLYDDCFNSKNKNFLIRFNLSLDVIYVYLN